MSNPSDNIDNLETSSTDIPPEAYLTIIFLSIISWILGCFILSIVHSLLNKEEFVPIPRVALCLQVIAQWCSGSMAIEETIHDSKIVKADGFDSLIAGNIIGSSSVVVIFEAICLCMWRMVYWLFTGV